MTYKEKVAWLQRYLKAREKANFLGGCVQEMEAEAEGMRTRLDGMPGAGRDTARLARHLPTLWGVTLPEGAIVSCRHF